VLEDLRRRWRRSALGFVRLRRLTPLSEHWGADRGQPIDRYYIERFLDRHRDRIRGHVLEVKDPRYTSYFGSGVTASTIVDIDQSNPQATLIADLATPLSLPGSRFNSAVVTQTLQYVSDLDMAIANLWHSLTPGGSLLITVPSTSKIDPKAIDVELWRVTPKGMTTLLRRNCPQGEFTVEGYGNVLVSAAFLYGLAVDELQDYERDYYDDRYPVVVCAVVRKPNTGAGGSDG